MFFSKIKRKYKETQRNRFFKRKWGGVNTDASFLCNNCIGGFIYKKNKREINSPTTWTLMLPEDFVKLCKNLREYLEKELTEAPFFANEYNILGGNISKIFPCGYLGDLKLMFPHSDSFLDAKQKWDRRKKRINFKKIKVILFLEPYYSFEKSTTKKILSTFQELDYDKVCIGYNRIQHLPNYYRLKCRDGAEWFQTNKGIFEYWEQFNWRDFLTR